jgi:hypothetical protein
MCTGVCESDQQGERADVPDSPSHTDQEEERTSLLVPFLSPQFFSQKGVGLHNYLFMIYHASKKTHQILMILILVRMGWRFRIKD